ncbi:MAG TPA: GNAT family N-acetyltransferase [Chitinophagaceae bacterium]|nr:GNAT family N-acetyltransferase [Chitinophagaceae bacterium]
MKVHLRKWRKEDIELLTKLADNKNIAANMSDRFPSPYTLKDAEEWILSNENKNPALNFAIEADSELAGACGMMLMKDVYRLSAEIGYWIAEPFWGRGIATQSVKLLLENIRQNFPDIIRVFAKPFGHNKASMKVLEKNGFYSESIRKKAVIKNNAVIDDCIYVKLLK